jgi:microcystin-dependent protein
MGQFVSTQTASDSPLGTIIAYMGITPPDGFLACDGSTYNIADYTALATHIMNEFGSYNYFGGNGTTTFAVPDLRGEFLRGTGTNSHSGQGNGANVGTHQNATIIPKIETSATDINSVSAGVGVSNTDKELTSSGTNNFYNKSGTWSATRNAAFTARPTNTSVLYCIKYTAGVSNQYSTTEQAVGTWIDGKTIYQRTYTVTVGNAADSFFNTGINTSSMDTVIEIGGYITTNNLNMININNYTDSTRYVGSLVSSSREVLLIYGASWVNATAIITLKYTKV